MPKKPVKKTETVNTTVPYQLIPEDLVPPAYFLDKKTGDIVPYGNVDGKYVPYEKAQIVFLERKIDLLQKQLNSLKEKYDKPAKN
jgi:hypothetical protein